MREIQEFRTALISEGIVKADKNGIPKTPIFCLQQQKQPPGSEQGSEQAAQSESGTGVDEGEGNFDEKLGWRELPESDFLNMNKAAAVEGDDGGELIKMVEETCGKERPPCTSNR